jgi:AP-4 complex subunit beta-1
MIFFYLNNYSEKNSELAFMAINSFSKDCEDMQKDVKLKGLALRSLCSLKFDGAFDYIKPSVLRFLSDPGCDPYVLKTAINGCIKLHYLNPNFVEQHDIRDILYNSIKNPNPKVVIAAINALNEIMIDEGGMAINGKIVIYLLGRLADFDEYGQSTILELVTKYKPKNQEELIDIMNHLADKLKDASPSVTLSTIKVLIQFIEYDSDFTEQVMMKIKTPLIALVTLPTMEMRYVVISHISNLISRGDNAKYFADSYKAFYCQADDKTYIQELKMEILVKLANQENLIDILNELGEYSSDIDAFLSKLSIKTFGNLGYKFPEKVQYIVKSLSYFVKINKTHLLDEITIAFKLILSSAANLPEASAIFQHIGDLFLNSQREEAKVDPSLTSDRTDMDPGRVRTPDRASSLLP